MIVWLVASLAGRLTLCLAGWFVGWLAGCLAVWPVHNWIQLLPCWLDDACLGSGWLLVRLVDWSIPTHAMMIKIVNSAQVATSIIIIIVVVVVLVTFLDVTVIFVIPSGVAVIVIDIVVVLVDCYCYCYCRSYC